MAQNMRCDMELQEHCKQKIAFDEMPTNIPDEMDKLEHGDQKIAFDEMPQKCEVPQEDHIIHEKDVTKENIVSAKHTSKSKRKGLKRHNKVGPIVRDSLCEEDVLSRIMSAPHSLPNEKESVPGCWDGLTTAAVGMKRRFISGCQRLVSRVRNVNCFRQKSQPRSPTQKSMIAAEQPKLEDELTTPVKLETIIIVDATGTEYGEVEVQAGVCGEELFQAVAKKLVKDVIEQAQARLMAEQAKVMVADIMAKAESNLRYLEIE